MRLRHCPAVYTTLTETLKRRLMKRASNRAAKTLQIKKKSKFYEIYNVINKKEKIVSYLRKVISRKKTKKIQ